MIEPCSFFPFALSFPFFFFPHFFFFFFPFPFSFTSSLFPFFFSPSFFFFSFPPPFFCAFTAVSDGAIGDVWRHPMSFTFSHSAILLAFLTTEWPVLLFFNGQWISRTHLRRPQAARPSLSGRPEGSGTGNPQLMAAPVVDREAAGRGCVRSSGLSLCAECTPETPRGPI